MSHVREVPGLERSTIPKISLKRAQDQGLDVSKIPTCAVPQMAGDKFVVRGCNQAHTCSRFGFGQPHLGGFGPRPDPSGNPVPGRGGAGPENVPYYSYNKPTGTEKEDFIPCHGWFIALHDKYEQQRATGDVIEILGREKDTKVTQLIVLPVAKDANKTGDVRMSETPTTILCPGFRHTDGQSARMQYALEIRRSRQRMAGAAQPRYGPGPENADTYDENAPIEEQVEAAAGDAASIIGDLDDDAPAVDAGDNPAAGSARNVGKPSRERK